jgi:hypothetical protein
MVAIQHLPPKQRAALILRGVFGLSAKDSALLLEASVASVNSALQRARRNLKNRLPELFDFPGIDPALPLFAFIFLDRPEQRAPVVMQDGRHRSVQLINRASLLEGDLALGPRRSLLAPW